MTLARLRDLCLALPGVTEQIQWGDNLVFKVGGRIFCIGSVEPSAAHVCSFKCEVETYGELCERDGIVPAPYLARAKWVALERWDALEDREYRDLIRRAYELVRAKLTKRQQAELDGGRPQNSQKSVRSRR